MSVTIRHVRVAAITSGGPTQDLTISSGPGTSPVAAMFLMNRCVTTNTEANHSQLCVGFTDGTRSRCGIVSSEHGVASSNTWNKAASDCVLMTVDPNTGTCDGRATFSSFGTDKVTISWSDFPAGAYFIEVILWFGTNIQVYVDNFNSLTDSSKNIGFQPDTVIGFGLNSSFLANVFDADTTSILASLAGGSFSIGFWNNNVQGCLGLFDEDGKLVVTYTTYCHSVIVNNGAFLSDTIASITIIPTATGFNISDDTSSLICGFLAINHGNQVTSKVVETATPTSTGDQIITGVGFKPQFILELQSALTAYNTSSDTNGASFGFGILTNDGTTNDSMNQRLDYATGPTNTITRSKQEVKAESLPKDFNSVVGTIRSTLVSFNDNGYTKNFTVVAASARKITALAIGETIPQEFMGNHEPLPDEPLEVLSYG